MLHDFFQFIAAWKAWHTLFHDFAWIDWLLTGACVVAVITGLMRGFSFLLCQLLILLFLVFAVLLIYPWLAETMTDHLRFAKSTVWKPMAFGLVFVAFFILLKKIGEAFSGWKMPRFHPWADAALGAVSGFFFALLWMSFISQFVLLLPLSELNRVYLHGGSRFGYVLQSFAPQAVDGALTPVRALVNRRP